jgi:hypothetical protein
LYFFFSQRLERHWVAHWWTKMDVSPF